MSKFGSELITSLEQAADHAKGRKVPGMRLTKVAIANVKAESRPRQPKRPDKPQD